MLKKVITQAKKLGIHSVVVIGGGEPTIYTRFKDLIAFIHSLNIIPVVFSNTILITPDLAHFLYEKNATIIGKLDSLRPEIQDFLAGRFGTFKLIKKGLNNLLNAGFTNVKNPDLLRLGISFVCNKLNIREIEDIWHFCRKNNIFPNMEILTPIGRALENLSNQALNKNEIKHYKLKLLDIDRKYYKYSWLPYTPITASNCLKHLYSLYITMNGDVRPCAPTKLDEHPSLKINGVYPYNVIRKSIKEIYKSKLFSYVRNIDKKLEGHCGSCEHTNECMGCRGYAYSIGINQGLRPLEALRKECPQCFKFSDEKD